MYCPSPAIQFSSRTKRQTSDQYYFNFIMDDVQHVRKLQDSPHLKPQITIVPDPVYSTFNDGLRYYKGDILDLEVSKTTDEIGHP